VLENRGHDLRERGRGVGRYPGGMLWMSHLEGASLGAGAWEDLDRCGWEATGKGVKTWTKDGTLRGYRGERV
jgi:hypothetical protein